MSVSMFEPKRKYSFTSFLAGCVSCKTGNPDNPVFNEKRPFSEGRCVRPIDGHRVLFCGKPNAGNTGDEEYYFEYSDGELA